MGMPARGRSSAPCRRAFSGQNTTAEIVPSPDGRVLYVSNRGQDSIAFLDIDPQTGTLTYAGSIPSGGARPRFFTLGPGAKQAFVANQDSDVISVFDIKPDRGRFVDTGVRITVGSPSAIAELCRPRPEAGVMAAQLGGCTR